MGAASPPARGAYRVVLVLPPDEHSPEAHRRHRFPHQGPAIVAASVALDGVACRLVDLDLDLFERPLQQRVDLDDEAALARHLRGDASDALVAYAREMIDRLGDVDCDAFAISVDRHTQIGVSALLGVELKRRFGRPVIVGGGNSGEAARRLRELGARGVDLITTATTPHEIRAAFAALRDVPPGRWEPAREPVPTAIPAEPDEWPCPDFSGYDLARYRRDPFLAEGARTYPRYDGSVGPRLFLPYHFAFDCQYACSFCQRGGRQSVKSFDRVVRDLATLAERHDCREFMLFDAQINLHADGFARALIDARLGVHWTDSFRVAPRRPKDVLDRMAESGCVGLTFGVETASDRMLKRMIKGHTAAQATAVVRDAHAREMFVQVNLLPCFPGERPDDHAVTRDWVRDNAWCIDEVVPSSFYLAEGSPVGQAAERYGIVLRGERELAGEHKFRKNLGSLAFDEVGGYTWEEREGMLRSSEEDLRQAWREGRAAVGTAVNQPSQMFALRRDAATKREAYARVMRWQHPGDISPVAYELLGRALAGERAPMPTPDAPAVAASPSVPLPPSEVTFPVGSLRARALAVVRRGVAPLGLTVSASAAEPGRLSLLVDDARGGRLALHLAAVNSGARFFKRGARAGFWYSKVAGPAVDPRWFAPVLKAVGDVLCAPPFDGLVDEPVAAVVPVRAPTPTVTAVAAPAGLRSFSVVDLVRRGLKPTASVLVASAEEALRDNADLPARALSDFGYARDARDNLVAVADPGTGPRMLYVGQRQAEVDRLRDIEHALYATGAGPGVDRAALQEELGRLLGFPPCCAAAFARRDREAGGHADFYVSVAQLGWHLAPVDWRLNHVVARQYELPFLNHVPCSADCRPTREQVDLAVAGLYEPAERRAIEAVLAQGAVLWPDDRAVFFTPRGAPDAAGELSVTAFNVGAPGQAGRAARPAERVVPVDAGEGYRDDEVTRLRVRDGRLEAFARGAWSAYAPSVVDRRAPPLVLTVRPRPPRRVSLTVLDRGEADAAVGESR